MAIAAAIRIRVRTQSKTRIRALPRLIPIDGASAYEVAVENGFVGDEAAWLASLVGEDGDPGAAATIAVGTVTTVAAGESATVTNVGTSNAAIFDFAIPQGEDGEDGDGSGDMLASTYDPQAIAGDAFDRANHTGTQTASTISDFSTAADARITAAIGSTVQAYSAALSSWASVTRASGFDTFAATPSSANLRALLSDETGTGIAYFVGGALGTPSSATLTNATGLPISTGVSGLGTSVASFLATPSSANLRAALTDESGTGPALFGGSSYIREKLTANRTYYVRSDGSDSNTGLVDSSGGAFLTIQKAWDVIVTLDLAGYTATINVGTGTFSGGLNATVSPVGGNVTLNGNGAANTILSVAGGCVIVDTVAKVTVQNMKLVSSGVAGVWVTSPGARLTVGSGVEFGACGIADIWASKTGATIEAASYTKSGNSSRHYLAQDGGVIQLASVTVTMSGTPAFSVATAIAQTGGGIALQSVTFSGAATGKRYEATLNGVINTFGGGASFIPGNSAGSTATGGQYA